MLQQQNLNTLDAAPLSKGKCLTPSQRDLLQQSLSKDLPKLYRTRIEIMLLTDEDKSQAEICQILGCTPATASRWIMSARSGMSHQWEEYRRGRPQKINQQYLQRLKELVSRSPRDFGYPFQRWTGEWLARHLAKEFGIKVTKHHINRLLKEVRPIQIKDLPLEQYKIDTEQFIISIWSGD